jgi:hypothetical protein
MMEIDGEIFEEESFEMGSNMYYYYGILDGNLNLRINT